MKVIRITSALLFCSFTIHAAQIINIGNEAEPKDLDPHICTGVPEYRLMLNLLEPLVAKDPKNLKPIPGVAESWKISKDGKVYTFKLRKNAKWSNGDPVTAQDFVYSWTRLLEPKTAAEYAYQAYYIKNGEKFNKGELKDASQLGIKALDDYTFEVTLENPTPFFIKLLYHHSLFPVNKKVVEKFGTKWTRPGNFVGNGAFVLDKWEMNKIIVLKKSPTYWDKDAVKLEQANMYPTENETTEERMFRNKELHIAAQVPLDRVDFWKADKSGAYQNFPYLSSYFYLINVTKKPLDNKLVRKALALSIDRTQIVKYITKGGQMPGTVFTPPGTGGYQPTPRLPADLSRLAEAKELLAKAGYPNGKGLPPIEIHYNTLEAHKKIAEAIQQMWKKNLGIQATLFNQEWKVYLDTQQSKNYMVSRMGWTADYNDPNTYLDLWVTGGGNNRVGWSNAEYDKLIAAAAKEHSDKKRFEYFRKAEDILLDELPIMPIYIYTRVYLKDPAVQGWYNNVEDIHPLKFVSIAEKAKG